MSAITIRKVSPVRVACVRAQLDSFYEQGRLWNDMFERLAQQNVEASGPTLTLLHSSNPIDVEICVPIADTATLLDDGTVHCRLLEERTMAVYAHRGAMADIGPAYSIVAAWMADNHKAAVGPSREVYVDVPKGKGGAVFVEIQTPIV
ncbi:hypothetical protein HDU98_000544 [Podochytrium sp. JEL0797]|nr:hypothetical protein HDU98_000544 [Podochytrium sp. JEL0797]